MRDVVSVGAVCRDVIRKSVSGQADDSLEERPVRFPYPGRPEHDDDVSFSQRAPRRAVDEHPVAVGKRR